MKTKNIVILSFLISGSFIQANIKKKLATHHEQITAAQQMVKTGKPIVVNDNCSRCNKNCRRCSNCGVCIRQ